MEVCWTSALHASRECRGQDVPAVLLSGDHAEIARWRYKQALGPELFATARPGEKLNLDREQQTLLDEFLKESGT